MANAIRHASADLVRITVRFDRRLVSLSVRDNGRGFDASLVDPLVVPHYGLLGMRERVERLGGTFALDSQPGHGTTVDVSVPLRT
jgi:signal transduction histidine kinase